MKCNQAQMVTNDKLAFNQKLSRLFTATNANISNQEQNQIKVANNITLDYSSAF